MNRSASFRTMSNHFISDGISVLKLSEAGFSYTGQGSVIKCDGCGHKILMESLRHDGHVMEPNEPKFHNDNCVFVRCKTSAPSIATLEEECEVVQDICSNPSQENLSSIHSTDGVPQFDSEQGHGDVSSLVTSSISQDRYVYDDSEDVDPDIEKINSHNDDKRNNCEKNPGHFGCCPVKNVTQDHLPVSARHHYVVKLLHMFSLLTVRIIVKLTNSGRSEHSEYKVGTGFVSLSDCDPNQKITAASKADEINELKTTSSDMLKNNKDTLILIETNKHLVRLDQDPGTVTVEFFYNDLYKGQFKTAEVVSILSGQGIGEHRSVLMCRPSDLTLVQQIKQLEQQISDIITSIPDNVKEFLSKKVFIIQHMHGREQYLSHGDCVQVKHKLLVDEVNKKFKLHKLSSAESVSEDHFKMLMYTADTCPGAAGAPVITFVKRSSDGQFVLDVWMHNGQSKQHGLGCTVMKACSSDDLVSNNPPNHEISTNGQKVMVPSASPNNRFEPQPSPIPHPSYPAYATKQKRSESYIGWCHNDVHEPEYLSQVGFFYAGYSDCVRCFQCGLGLRSWKPGDNVLDEHRKYRADCPFLQNLINSGTQHYLNKII